MEKIKIFCSDRLGRQTSLSVCFRVENHTKGGKKGANFLNEYILRGICFCEILSERRYQKGFCKTEYS
nr:MAG TPA: hypothetical protein [Caudoviricetes sp.]